jgi:signal peptidase II
MVFVLIAAILFLDQITKIVVLQHLSLNQSFVLIPKVLYLTLVHNRGAAFGILKNQVPFFIFTSSIAIILIIVSLKRNKRIYNISLSLILAGALGNLTDRLFLGYVVDFIDFRIWPVFNLADSAITIGAILLGYSLLNTKKSAAD